MPKLQIRTKTSQSNLEVNKWWFTATKGFCFWRFISASSGLLVSILLLRKIIDIAWCVAMMFILLKICLMLQLL